MLHQKTIKQSGIGTMLSIDKMKEIKGGIANTDCTNLEEYERLTAEWNAYCLSNFGVEGSCDFRCRCTCHI